MSHKDDRLTDLRIVNTCSNNCLYCLEQSYRKKDKYIKKDKIFQMINHSNIWKHINFYWWNPLLHPDLLEIVKFSEKKFKHIWILTNTYTLTQEKLQALMVSWLNSIWFYFNSFDQTSHETVNQNGIGLKQLVWNIKLIQKSGIFYKAIIHINNVNIKRLYKDIFILHTKFHVNNMEFINYFPFDRPYEYKNLLEYDISDNRKNIDNIFSILEKFHIKSRFIKFEKLFFWDFIYYYDFEKWILEQIWEEDMTRLSWENIPFCYTEKRCNSCFIKDNCKFYRDKK